MLSLTGNMFSMIVSCCFVIMDVTMKDKGFPCGSAGKESACNAGDLGSIPGLGRSPGEVKHYPLQYSGLENSMNCIVHGVTESQTQLSAFHFQMTLKGSFKSPRWHAGSAWVRQAESWKLCSHGQKDSRDLGLRAMTYASSHITGRSDILSSGKFGRGSDFPGLRLRLRQACSKLWLYIHGY